MGNDMRLGFFGVLIACLAFALFASNLVVQEAAAQQQLVPEGSAKPQLSPPYTAADWIKREFWSSDNPIWKSSTGWVFKDDEIRLERPGDSGHLFSPPLPPNFDLSWKWKIAKGTNSGLKYRLRKSSNYLFDNKYLGVEYQIIDSKPNAISNSSTAAVYGLFGPVADKPLNPPGQWNQARVVAVGNQLKHYLNGKLVTEVTTEGVVWDAAMAKSKFFGVADFGQPKTGDRIMLTDHGGWVSYKDFQFTELKVDPQSVDAATVAGKPPHLGNAMRNNWADQTSVMLWTRTTTRPEMLAKGKRFVSLDKKVASRLAKTTNAEKLLAAQLPDGATLDQMLGACPGTPGRVRLTYFPAAKVNRRKTTPWVTTEEASDFTAKWKLENLQPGTTYAAIVEAKPIDADQLTAVIRGSFATAPKANARRDLKFCVTTCHDFIRTDNGLLGHKIYPAMTKIQPDFMVHAGDIEYYDKPDPWAMTMGLMRFKWQRIFSLPDNRKFYQHAPSYFLKDDHDTLKDDCWPGQSYGSVTFEQGVKLFNEEQFPADQPRYKTVRWGKDLQIWLLEGRDHRSHNDIPDGPDKSILGVKQKRWLTETLNESDAKFKLIFSPTPIVGPDRDKKKDNHANEIFAYEGNELRKLLGSVEGVIVLCGDRHWQYASVQPETNLWEFGCGPGSEEHQLGWKDGDERPEHKFLRVAGGFLSGEVFYQGPGESSLTIRHHKVTGEEVSRFVFPMKKPEGKQAPAQKKELTQAGE